MRTDEPRTVALGQWNAARSYLYRWPSQHDANVVRKHQDIVKSVKGFPKASRHLLKRQGKKIKRHGAVTLGRFGANCGRDTESKTSVRQLNFSQQPNKSTEMYIL